MKETIQRIEKKYILTKKQALQLYEMIKEHLKADRYPTSKIYNLYLDNDQMQLVTTSSLKPIYKEKIRIRSYKEIKDDHEEVFVEIKKKYKKVVTKRRVALPYQDVIKMMNNEYEAKNQIEKEIMYAMQTYKVKPKIFLAYDRVSYLDVDDDSLRITFDEHIRGRSHDLALKDHIDNEFLNLDQVIMEVKAHHALPKYFCDALSCLQLYSSSFSKVSHVIQMKKIYEEVF